MAHDEGGHFGVRKTYAHLLKFWPRVKNDVVEYIKTCNVCQLTGKPNKHITPAPLQPIPAVSEPFEHLIVDCVGPLPSSKSGCKYLLTIMCQSTRYPAAYPLRSITTKAVVKALTRFISIFGIPRVIQSDQGLNFSSHMLRAYCTEMDRDWEDGMPWLMLAAREAVQESTGFSPNELVFSHRVQWLLALLKAGWVDVEPPKNLIDFVNGFRHRLFVGGGMAKRNLQMSQNKMKKTYDRRIECQEFSLGDQVLALMPVVSSPFQAKYTGPYTVAEKVLDLNYLIARPGRKKSTQLCHVSLLKPYYNRVTDVAQAGKVGVHPALAVSPLSQESDGVPEPDDSLLCGQLKNYFGNLEELLFHLADSKCGELSELMH